MEPAELRDILRPTLYGVSCRLSEKAGRNLFFDLYETKDGVRVRAWEEVACKELKATDVDATELMETIKKFVSDIERQYPAFLSGVQT